MLERVHAAEQALMREVGQLRSPRLEAAMRGVSFVADNSKLWMASSAALAVFGGRRQRRAAVRGLMSVAVTSAVVNGPLKSLTQRRRPDTSVWEQLRLPSKRPRTSSFPSGHSASAAAFAVGAACEEPALAVPLGLAAVAVGYSRVHTGAHYPSDVLVGLSIGAAVALASRRIWPVAPAEAPALRRAARPDPAWSRPDGSGVVICLNPASGSGTAGECAAELRSLAPALQEDTVAEGGDLREVLLRAAERAEVLGVVGGDGSVAVAAEVAADKGLPLLVAPGGTLNHFARDLGLDSSQAAVDALAAGSLAEVDLGVLTHPGGKHVFVNTASVGAYPELVDAREELEGRLGKWPALAVALARVMGSTPPLNVEIDGTPRRIWMAFVGAGRYHPAGFAPSWRDALDDGLLDIRVVDADQPWARSRLVAAVLTGRLGKCRVYEQRTAAEVSIRLLDGAQRIATDGESHDATGELRFAKQRKALRVYAPAQ